MDSNIPFYSLPFVDSAPGDEYNRNKDHAVYEVHSTLPPDDVIAQFLDGDEPLEEPDLNGPTTLHCEICQKKFDNAKKYYGHLRVHSKENSWKCEKCPDLRFSTKQQLMKHGLTHKPLERVWKCVQCSVSFEALWRLQQHLYAKHLNYRPLKCDECEKAFYKKSDLKKHKNTHSKEQGNHVCPQCGRAFQDKSNLGRHMLRHTNEKPFACPSCGNRFKQSASMKRHSAKCASNKVQQEKQDGGQTNYTYVASATYQSVVVDFTIKRAPTNVPPPEPERDDKLNQANTEANRIVDNIVDDILSAEDDYMTMHAHNEMLNVYNQEIDNHSDNTLQIELLKEMSQLNMLDGELFYDLDLDATQNNQIFNNHELDYGHDRNEVLYDFTAPNKSLDQDIMNVLYPGKQITDDLLNPEALNSDKTDKFSKTDAPVAVNECATIFESDVDLEASTNLAANLNQLIGENNVQYISTEDDDTFIISLNSEIDAEQLTDMLNIGTGLANEKPDENVNEIDNDFEEADNTDPLIVKIQEPKTAALDPRVDSKEVKKVTKRTKKCVLYICRDCNKVFKKKDNYKSHIATHEPSLRQHKCAVCGARFGYRSTLNKHRRAAHEPRVVPAHPCRRCDKAYDAAWKLRMHVERIHEGRAAHACYCGKAFYKQDDLRTHMRSHSGEKPYSCDVCNRAYSNASHLRRHIRIKHRKMEDHSRTTKKNQVCKLKQQAKSRKL